jgi:ATP-dependent Lhr-like helicase
VARSTDPSRAAAVQPDLGRGAPDRDPHAGARRWMAVEDAARLRDALGVQIPKGIPEALLEPVADPVGDVVYRYARTHGPFTSDQAAADLGLPVGPVVAALERIEGHGRLTRGAFRPGGHDRGWTWTCAGGSCR